MHIGNSDFIYIHIHIYVHIVIVDSLVPSMPIIITTQLLVVSLYPMGVRFWAMFLTSRRRSGLYPVMVAFVAYCFAVY